MVNYKPEDNNPDPSAPFDGVVTTDHPETYGEFFISRCFRQSADTPYFYDINNFEIVICNRCIEGHRIIPTPSFTRQERLHNVGIHGIPALYCDFCKRDLQTIRPVEECGLCTQLLLERINRN